ncbi:hypothetical protein BGZ61DRAFT_477519 [Ilyonectria robusta]|uniref:uncharacterized protein n=1 Tax=Ilyonectria robusta TaxID=1079257 RepID=UPI001E8EDC5B|nr:uncharacterized protein BGZ61DRAFT_477519 [Ilyonectria robusta]KAH8699522.1 hypothetical protein BGZ61DRAFT_477519 [Ilyonectria robusta]
METSLIEELMLAEESELLRIEEQMEKDEQEEWEYEYSTTETETYYLTIELSYPEFKDRQSRVVHHSRGGYYKNWLDQNLAKTTGGLEIEGDNDNDEPLPEPEADDDEPEIDPELLNKGKGVDRGEGDGGHENDKAQDDDERTEDIQILELHSKNPVISYKGRVFEGEWAEVIGTEAIFANHDNGTPLPALRHLEKNLDLLGASASRILTTEKVLKPKIRTEDPLAAIREEWNIRIPVGKDRTGERAQQTRFLENLIALKKKKGETDQVTVYAKDGEGKDFKDTRDPDYKPRRRRRIFNEDGEEVIPLRERRRGGRRIGRPRGRGRGRGGVAATPTTDVSSTATGTGVLSTPTPGRWDELDEREDDDDDEDDDEEGDEEMDDGSDSDEVENMSMMD